MSENELEFRFFEKQSLVGIAIFRDNKIIYANRVLLEIFEYSAAEIINRDSAILEKLIHPDDREMVMSRYYKRLSGDSGVLQQYDYRLLTKKGTTKWVTMHAQRLEYNDEVMLVFFLIDITDRKKTETALIESENRFRAVIETARDCIFIKDSNRRYTHVNPAMEKLYGHSSDQIIGKTFEEMSGKDTGDRIRTVDERILKGEIVEEEHLDEFNGVNKTFSSIKVPLYDNNGTIYGLCGISRDITERKNAEEALKESEARYRTIFNNTAVSIWEYDLSSAIERLNRMKLEDIADYHAFFNDHPELIREIFSSVKPVDVNKTTLALYGAATKEELLASYGKNPTPEAITALINAFIAYLEGKQYYEGETVNITLDGRRIHALIGITFPFIDKIHSRALVTVTDITERKLLEDERAKASKLESIGILAGGIAHDFNNLLAVVMGNISLSLAEIDAGSRVFVLLNEVEKACERARGLTQQLLTFSKGGEPVRETVSAAAFLKETVMFSLIGSNVAAKFSIDSDLWHVDIDKSQIHQAINNIIINAVQAMPGGGTISVSADNIMINDSDNLPLDEGAYIKISIADEGTGIPQEHLSKIFDPYFTTKQKGTGLGLATTYSIVNRHNGYIAAESMPGHGSTFHLYLPASSMKAAEEKPVAVSAERMTGKILIMDDDIQLRTIVSDMLVYLGNETEVAADGIDAIEIYRRAFDSGNRFDAVILDLTIPGGMGGRETIGKLLEIDPEVKAIVSSGYSHDPVLAEYSKYGFVDYLAKPYHLDNLKNVLNRVLPIRSPEK